MKKQVKFGSKQGKPSLSNALLSSFKCKRLRGKNLGKTLKGIYKLTL